MIFVKSSKLDLKDKGKVKGKVFHVYYIDFQEIIWKKFRFLVFILLTDQLIILPAHQWPLVIFFLMMKSIVFRTIHCVNSVLIQSFLVFIESESRKILTRKTPNTDTFHAVMSVKFFEMRVNITTIFFAQLNYSNALVD